MRFISRFRSQSHSAPRSKSAWTLVETSISLTIIAVVLMIAIVYSVDRFKKDAAAERDAKFKKINMAIKAYVIKNGKYPCPASLSANPITNPGSIPGASIGENSGCFDAANDDAVFNHQDIDQISFTVAQGGSIDAALTTAMNAQSAAFKAKFTSGFVIIGVRFASYGNPPSSPISDEYVKSNANCHADNSSKLLFGKCYGKSNCQGMIADDTTFFGSTTIPLTCTSPRILKVTLAITSLESYKKGSSAIVIGAVPYQTIGLNKDDVIDGNGNLLQFYVPREVTVADPSQPQKPQYCTYYDNNCKASLVECPAAVTPCDNTKGSCFNADGTSQPATPNALSSGGGNIAVAGVASTTSPATFSGSGAPILGNQNCQTTPPTASSFTCQFDETLEHDSKSNIPAGDKGTILCKAGYKGSVGYDCLSTITSNTNITNSLQVDCTAISSPLPSPPSTTTNSCYFAAGNGYPAYSGIPIGKNNSNYSGIICSSGYSGNVIFDCAEPGGDISAKVAEKSTCKSNSLPNPPQCYVEALAGCYNGLSPINAGASGTIACASTGNVSYTCPSSGGGKLTPTTSATCCIKASPAVYCEIPETTSHNGLQNISAPSSANNASLCKTGYSGGVDYECEAVTNAGTTTGQITYIKDKCIKTDGKCDYLASDSGHYKAKSGISVGTDVTITDGCKDGYAGSVTYTCPSSGGRITPSSSSCALISTTLCTIAADSSSPSKYAAQTVSRDSSNSFNCADGFKGSVRYSCDALCACNTTPDCTICTTSCSNDPGSKNGGSGGGGNNGTNPAGQTNCTNTDPNYAETTIGSGLTITAINKCPVGNDREQKTCNNGTFTITKECPGMCILNNTLSVSANIASYLSKQLANFPNNIVIPGGYPPASPNSQLGYTGTITCPANIYLAGSISYNCSQTGAIDGQRAGFAFRAADITTSNKCLRICYFNDSTSTYSSSQNLFAGLNALTTATQTNATTTTGTQTCNKSGFTGSFTYNCADDGTITNVVVGSIQSACQCVVPTSPNLNVSVTAVNQTPSSTVATLTCATGYYDGVDYKCDASGFVQQGTRSCKPITCLLNAQGITSQTVNYTATPTNINCGSGYDQRASLSAIYTCTAGINSTTTSTNPGTINLTRTCTPITCSILSKTGIADGTQVSYATASDNKTVACNVAGYVGNLSYTCTGTSNPGTFSTSQSCTLITCNIPASANTIQTSIGYTTSATALTCKSGYTGSPTATCTGTSNPGNFAISSGSCLAQCNCNGTMINSGTTCATSCPTGQTGPGYNQVCTNGILGSQTGSCTPITCTIASGTGYASRTVNYGSGSFACDTPGYSGTLSYNCTSSGGSITPTGSCTPITCTGSVAGVSGTSWAYASSLASRACDASGYTGSVGYTCTTNGAAPSISGSCTSLTCSTAAAGLSNCSPTTVANGSSTTCNDCPSGQSGSRTYTCNSGSLTQSGSSCTPITCTGSVTGVSGTSWAYASSLASRACDASGYSGSVGYTCTTNGAAPSISGSCAVCSDVRIQNPDFHWRYGIYQGSKISFSYQGWTLTSSAGVYYNEGLCALLFTNNKTPNYGQNGENGCCDDWKYKATGFYGINTTITIGMDKPYTVTSFDWFGVAEHHGSNRNAKNVSLEGSVDGANWTRLLDFYPPQNARTDVANKYSVPNNQPYQFYRFIVSGTWGDTSTVKIGGFIFYSQVCN